MVRKERKDNARLRKLIEIVQACQSCDCLQQQKTYPLFVSPYQKKRSESTNSGFNIVSSPFVLSASKRLLLDPSGFYNIGDIYHWSLLIDYGILYTTYYRENRATMDVKNALIAAYNGSIHTLLTSGLIMILVTGILGNFFPNPTEGQICLSLSKGALSATILIVFILPGILATFDKAICRKKDIQIPTEHN
ncbi:MAG: hypothetical protein EOM54_12075 [Clostridia bacterium]|nr:hypothetical protein [Clostridia bacterium]